MCLCVGWRNATGGQGSRNQVSPSLQCILTGSRYTSPSWICPAQWAPAEHLGHWEPATTREWNQPSLSVGDVNVVNVIFVFKIKGIFSRIEAAQNSAWTYPRNWKLESLSLIGLDLRVAFTLHALLHLYLPAYLHGSLCVDCRRCFGGFIVITEEQTTSILRCKHGSFALSSGLPVSYCDANAFATALSQIRKNYFFASMDKSIQSLLGKERGSNPSASCWGHTHW